MPLHLCEKEESMLILSQETCLLSGSEYFWDQVLLGIALSLSLIVTGKYIYFPVFYFLEEPISALPGDIPHAPAGFW